MNLMALSLTPEWITALVAIVGVVAGAIGWFIGVGWTLRDNSRRLGKVEEKLDSHEREIENLALGLQHVRDNKLAKDEFNGAMASLRSDFSKLAAQLAAVVEMIKGVAKSLDIERQANRQGKD